MPAIFENDVDIINKISIKLNSSKRMREEDTTDSHFVESIPGLDGRIVISTVFRVIMDII
jgi:hypothetical protein